MEFTGAIQLPDGLGMALIIVLMAILIDTLLGVLISLKLKTFNWGKLSKFVMSGVLPYIGGLLLIAGAALLINFFHEMFFAVGGVIILKYAAEIIIKVKKLFLPSNR